jgi:hypothetical protein
MKSASVSMRISKHSNTLTNREISEETKSLSENRYPKEDELGECRRVVREPGQAVAQGGDEV